MFFLLEQLHKILQKVFSTDEEEKETKLHNVGIPVLYFEIMIKFLFSDINIMYFEQFSSSIMKYTNQNE